MFSDEDITFTRRLEKLLRSYYSISIHEGFSVADLAVMEPFPFATTRHLPKKALRWGAVKRSIEVWQPLSVPRMPPSPS